MFHVGEYVVDSVNGICRIEGEVTLDYVEDKDRLYFLLIPLKDEKSKVYIPITSADKRLREILTEQKISDLLDEINDIDSIWIENDKERERIYKDVVKSCEPKQLVSIIKTLYFRKEQRSKEGKKNTTVDEKYFRQAEDNLYSEIGFVLSLNNEEVKSLIKDKVNLKECV